MKSRHMGRELALSTLYALDFNGELVPGMTFGGFPTMSEEEQDQIDAETSLFARYLITGTLDHIEEIDSWISRYSINRPIEKIDCIDRNILRMSVFSLLYARDIHSNVIITEAVRLSQEYSREVNYKFINGILDSMRKEIDDHVENS
ncbi:MAG: transcription antitermination factor NusB [Sphaerochaetaceae bacterium]|nr:transcription antitermination factor NusB [Sphaerochaetaceae bacterium]MDD3942243.1 transcription antitermination factor NusB [Sphaerochaetaceae bacterium]MDX9938894.1 transcription antitermination factor NusB [Sphaerochaetaceae bacterium]